jgi:hypothetical protein
MLALPLQNDLLKLEDEKPQRKLIIKENTFTKEYLTQQQPTHIEIQDISIPDYSLVYS